MNLVIVESGAKAKTIEKYLKSIQELQGKGTFKVVASLGHIRDLPAKKIGINTETWEADYENIISKKSLIAKLKSESSDAQKVYLASDLDFEGESIAFHLKNVLKLPRSKYERVTFNEITKDALRNAFMNPRDIDMNMVNAQESRRFLDRIVGYEVSPLLWKRFSSSGLSAGRVQSVALKMIVDRFKEANQHIPEIYWTISAEFDISIPEKLNTKLYSLKHKKVATFDKEESIIKILNKIIKNKTNWNIEFSEHNVNNNPSAPFITSSLQQEAYNLYKIPAKRTMQLAQDLYESGHITYMRTDSTSLSEDALNSISKFITTEYGSDKLNRINYITKNSHAQQAHEAIRPTNIEKSSVLKSDTNNLSNENSKITEYHNKLYNLIWRRTIASQMVSAIYKEIIYKISHECIKEKYIFEGKTKILIADGYLKVYRPDTKIELEILDKWNKIIGGKNKESTNVNLFSINAEGDITRPIVLYNEPGLIKVLEKVGIGRPSTYATILDKLFTKGYVINGNIEEKSFNVKNYKWHLHNGNSDIDDNIKNESDVIRIGGTSCADKDKLIPSTLGENVIQYLNESVPQLLDVNLTASVEENMDNISENKNTKIEVLNNFYKDFHKLVTNANETIKEIAKKNKESGSSVKKDKKEKSPSNIIREFPELNVNIVKTRFGNTLFNIIDKKFIGLLPFLEWKNKTEDSLNDTDVRFLLSLPLKYQGTNREIHMGRYGLYIKDNSQNIRLDKNKWESIYDGTFKSEDIINIENTYVPKTKKTWAKKK